MSTRFDPQLLSLASYPYRMDIAPRFADMDILRHLNNLSLAEYHEEVRTRFLMSLFGEDFLSKPRDYRLLPVSTHYDYLAEAHYPQPLIAAAGVLKIGRASFDVAMALFQNERCVCLSRATTVHVLGGQSQPLPESLRAALGRGLMRAA